ncbi:MAG TPA: preprotein translocase subunit YajC [Candidatus Cryptobacteroides intestinipullorum]|nr:preprotein translocase subunit YajC [Candidatus Cryptobacteroides intestinipullorum]
MEFITLLQAQAAGNQAAAGQSSWSMWIMLILIFVVMWFFMIRPQRKQQKELQKFREGLKKGDKVVTVGGIYGTVVEVKEKTLLLEVDSNVKIRVDKNSVVKDFSETAQQ